MREDRLAHLIRDAARAQARALQMRLLEHAVSFGHWVGDVSAAGVAANRQDPAPSHDDLTRGYEW